MQITPELIEDFADQATVRQGERLYNAGFAQIRKIQSDHASVLVHGQRKHQVHLYDYGSGLIPQCNCSVARRGRRCEHVIAALFAILHYEEQPSPIPFIDTLLKDDERKGGGRRHVPSWAKSLAKVLDQSDRKVQRLQKEAQHWRLVFSLIIDGNKRRIQIYRIRTRKNGSDGQPSSIGTLPYAELERLKPSERLLLSILLPRYEISFPELNGTISTRRGTARSTLYEIRSDEQEWSDVLTLLREMELYLWKDGNPLSRRLRIEQLPGKAVFSLSEGGGELRLFPEIDWNGSLTPVSDDVLLISDRPLWVLSGDTIRRIEGIEGSEFLRLQRMHTPLVVPVQDREYFVQRALPQILLHYPLRSSTPDIQTINTPPRLRLYLRESAGSLLIGPRFVYGGVEVPPDSKPGNTPETHPSNGGFVAVQRNAADEEALLASLMSTDLVGAGPAGTHGLLIPDIDPLEWLLERLPGLRAANVEVFGEKDLRRYCVRTGPSTISLTVSSGIDWFDMNVDVKFEGTAASLQAFVSAVQEGKKYVRLTDGSYGVLPQTWLRKFKAATTLGSAHEGTLRLSRSHLTMIEELAETTEINVDENYRQLRERLRSFTGIIAHPLPEGFTGTLRPYQQAGYDWLRFLHEFGLGGLLADDMGLGKTVQALTILLHSSETEPGIPSLVVVPTSLVHNWQHEAQQFTPRLKVLLYHGPERMHYREEIESYHLIVTSYGILRRDIEFLSSLKFSYVVLDESQNIKNFASVNARASRHLQAAHRIALTGTPVENNLSELWSQFQFTNPGFLGGLHSFTEHFARPIERDRDEDAAASLRRITRPFLLRRTKELVAADLPPKIESVVVCSMEESQRSAYQHWREYYRLAITKSIDTVGLRRSTVKVLEGLTKLRLVCCHPQLADERYRGSSGKFDAFTEMLDDILAEGHRVLVFSQFVKMLSILRKHLDKHGIVYEYLDGRTLRRKERIDRFQNDDNIKAFLISLRAGGTGLNLTAADYVIHYDPWWNPAVEAQATDRTHRIGQTRKVMSYKLITRDTVEEKIVTLQDRKKALVGSVISTESGFLKSLTLSDIEDLFS